MSKLPSVNTCIQHIAPAMQPPYHDTMLCRCLIDHQPVFTYRGGAKPCKTKMRLQPESIAAKLNVILDDMGLPRIKP